MNKINLEDTIAAVSTAAGSSGIGIVRVTGSNSAVVMDKLFVSPKKTSASELKTHTVNYGHIMFDGEVIDEVLLVVMLRPHTYTKQDVFEINCHGGTKCVAKVLECVLKSGARLAEPGEFTKRAFLNGRIDLSQAEAVIDIINATTEISHKTALNRLNGRLSGKVKAFREEILNIAASIEAAIDYPEHDQEEITIADTEKKIDVLIKDLKSLYNTADTGRIIREGIKTVIMGTPNVGKSSLLNYLLDEERAIVSDVPGTTRDVLHEFINLNGLPLKIIDTAGIRETDDAIEQMGVSRSFRYAGEADLILLVLDGSKPLGLGDLDILSFIKENNKKALIIVNKTDLPQDLDLERLNDYGADVLFVSVKEDMGFDRLYDKINELFLGGDINLYGEEPIINERIKSCLYNGIESLNAVLKTIENNMPIDFITIDLMDSYKFLGEIIGETVEDDIIDRIFSEFCLGK